MFGVNEMVVNTASHPHGKLHKGHNALSYHKTCASIAAGITQFHHARGDTNLADILSKHWDFPSVWKQLKPLLFHTVDTADLVENREMDEAERGATWQDTNKVLAPHRGE